MWVTQEGVKEKPGDIRNELWIMNADGSEQQRVTYFNEPGHIGYTGYEIITGDSSWSADGRRLAVYRIMADKENPDSVTFPGRTTEIVILEFE